MKCQLREALLAHSCLVELSHARYNKWHVVFQLAELVKAAARVEDLYIEQEKKLIGEYAMKNEDGTFKTNEKGNVLFESPEIAQEFQKEIVNLQSTEIDMPEPVYILPEYFKSEEDIPTPEHIILLDKFVKFSESKEA